MTVDITQQTALSGAAQALAAVELALAHEGPVVVLAGNEQQSHRLEEDLRFFLAGRMPLLHLPDTEILPYDQFSPHQEILSDRLRALARLPEFARGIVLVTADALIHRLPPRDWLAGRSCTSCAAA